MRTLVEAVAKHASNKKSKPALILDGQTCDYQRLWKLATSLALRLRGLGIKKGARVLAYAKPSLEYVALMLGVQLAGAVFVPFEKSMKQNGIEQLIQLTGADCVVFGVNHPAGSPKGYVSLMLDRLLVDLPLDESDEWIGFPDEQDDDVILFTTGTTGKSKGVLLTHAATVATIINYAYGPSISGNDVMLIPLPLNHGNGFRHMQTMLYLGGTAVLMDGLPSLGLFFQALKDYGVSGLTLTPSAIRYILRLAPDELGKHRDQIKYIATYSAGLPEDERETMIGLLPDTRLIAGYGCTESISACSYDYSKYRGRPHCAGRPNPEVEVSICDGEGKAIQSSPNDTGLIAIRAKTAMKCYWNDPAATEKVLRDGVLYTSDEGYIDAEGFLYVLGRKGEVINVGGLKVSPSEVEEAAMRHESVADCACVGVPDSIFGQAVKLYVVPGDARSFSVPALKISMAEDLESYKVPKFIEQIDAIPRTQTGKIMRQKL